MQIFLELFIELFNVSQLNNWRNSKNDYGARLWWFDVEMERLVVINFL